MQLSTVLSDGVLAVVSFWAAWIVYNAGLRPGAIAFLLTGAAAFAGVLRFSVFPGIVPVHSTLSAMAGQVGIPLLGLSFAHAVFRVPVTTLQLEAAGVALLAVCLVNRFVFPIPFYATVIGGIGALIIIVAGVRSMVSVAGVLAIGGAIVLIVAGLAIGSSGEIWKLRRVDLYHYALAISMWMMGTALRKILV
ncbi:MAG: hypothetical protein JNM27_00260 [Leptospirales bacterium]|nr:hypothetical protein [Leptospirales bacterium]